MSNLAHGQTEDSKAQNPIDEIEGQLLAFRSRDDPQGVWEAFYRPGAFLHQIYNFWRLHNMGGSVSHTFRGLKDELVRRKEKVRNLQPKIYGKAPVSKEDAEKLLRIILENWNASKNDKEQWLDQTILGTPSQSIDKDGSGKNINVMISNLSRRLFNHHHEIRIKKPIGMLPENFFEERGKLSLALILPTKPQTVTQLSVMNIYAGFSALLGSFFKDNPKEETSLDHSPLLIWLLRLPSVRESIEFHESFYTLSIHASAIANWYFRLRKQSGIEYDSAARTWSEIISRCAFVINGLPNWRQNDDNSVTANSELDQNLADLEYSYFLPDKLPYELTKSNYVGDNMEHNFGLTVSVEPDNALENAERSCRIQYWLFEERPEFPVSEAAETTGLPILDAERSPGADYDLAYDAVFKAASVTLGIDASNEARLALHTLHSMGWEVLRVDELQEALKVGESL